RADRDFAAAFRKYDIDVDSLTPAEAMRRIRRRYIRDQLAVALDTWADVRRATPHGDDAGWQRLIQVARLADPDPSRNGLRDALARKGGQTLKALAAKRDVAALPASTLVVLGNRLAGVGALPEAILVLRRGQQQHPDDFWINHQLALFLLLVNPSQVDEAIGF